MENPDREQILGLLNQLGTSDDGEALQAARQLHHLVTDSRIDWDDLLTPDGGSVVEPAAPAPAPAVDLEDAAALALIDQLLARGDLAESTRDELSGYREDIAEQQFTEDDRRYLVALDSRL